jgi:hypothetical protein
MAKLKSNPKSNLWQAHRNWWIALGVVVILGAGTLVWVAHITRGDTAIVEAQGQALSSPTATSSVTPDITPIGGSPTPPKAAAAAATPTPSKVTESTINGTGGQSTAIAPTDSDSSTCSGAAGASCHITFTSASSTTTAATLAAQTIGAGGSTSWTWTPAGLELAPGAYIIQAFATANGQTTASNQETLYVHS